MYLRSVHAETSTSAIQQLIRENPLGILTTAIPSKSFPLLQSTHIPWVLDVEKEDDEANPGVLRGHLARSNPQSKVMMETLLENPKLGGVLEQEVMVLFNSSVQHYVTPKFYTETKPNSGKVVPTWNYAAAAAYGKARIYFDSKSDESISFLSKQIDDLSQYAEEKIMGFTGTGDNMSAWKISDAPPNFISIIQKTIIGIEIKIDRLEGKFKMSQEMSKGDRNGVIKGFGNLGTEVAQQMSDLVQQRGDLTDQKKLAARAH